MKNVPVGAQQIGLITRFDRIVDIVGIIADQVQHGHGRGFVVMVDPFAVFALGQHDAVAVVNRAGLGITGFQGGFIFAGGHEQLRAAAMLLHNKAGQQRRRDGQENQKNDFYIAQKLLQELFHLHLPG